MKKFYRIMYEIFKYLPSSMAPAGKIFKILRRWSAKGFMAHCGKNVNIENKAKFSSKVELGDNSGIGIRANINGKCIIGKDVMMGPDCIIYTRNHKTSDTNIPMMYQGFEEEKPVFIGDDVWIGGRVIILPGVHIGSHSIIGAGAVVTKDVPEWVVAAGNPAVVKKYRKNHE